MQARNEPNHVLLFRIWNSKTANIPFLLIFSKKTTYFSDTFEIGHFRMSSRVCSFAFLKEISGFEGSPLRISTLYDLLLGVLTV